MAIIDGGNRVHQPIPDSCFPPSDETIVTGGARPIAFGKIPPWCAGTQHPEDAVEHAAVIDAGHSSWLVRQYWLGHAPIEGRRDIFALPRTGSPFCTRLKTSTAYTVSCSGGHFPLP